MATSDELSTLIVLAHVLETPAAAVHARKIVAESLISPWAKKLGSTMIAEAAAAAPTKHGPASSSVAEPAPKHSSVQRDLQAVRSLAGLSRA
jgi:hypothetical protein